MNSQIAQLVSNYARGVEQVDTIEVTSYVVFHVWLELDVKPNLLDTAGLALGIVWEGAAAAVKRLLKRGSLEDSPDPSQEELFPGHSAFVCIAQGPHGEGTFKRIRACFRREYLAHLVILEEGVDRDRKKIDRRRVDYDLALPYWKDELTFQEAHRLATKHRGV